MARIRTRHIVHAVALVVGSVALALLLHRLGWAGTQRVLANTGAWFLVIAAIDLASVVCDAAGVYAFVRPQAPVGFLRVFAAQASGLAINRLTPGNSLGEPIKVTMLLEHVPQSAAVSGIVLFNLATYSIAIVAIVVGVPLTLLLVDLPPRVQIAVWIATIALIAFALGMFVLVKRGALGLLIDALARLRIISATRAKTWHAKVAEIDVQVRQFGSASSRRGLAMILCSRLLNWTGTIVLLYASGVPLTPVLVIAQLSVGILVTWMSNIVPLGIGLADGGNYLLYRLVGAGPTAGLDFTLVNRARTCVLAGMGLTVMALANLVDRLRR